MNNPALADQPDAVFELLYGVIWAARALGLPIVVDEYAARSPHLADRLRRQMTVAAWFDDAEEDAGPFAAPCWRMDAPSPQSPPPSSS